jgi:hypothetical protein
VAVRAEATVEVRDVTSHAKVWRMEISPEHAVRGVGCAEIKSLGAALQREGQDALSSARK